MRREQTGDRIHQRGTGGQYAGDRVQVGAPDDDAAGGTRAGVDHPHPPALSSKPRAASSSRIIALVILP